MLANKLRAATGVAAALTAGVLIAACGSSSVASGTSAKYMTMPGGKKMLISGMTTDSKTKTSGMSKMGMSVDTKTPSVGGQKAVATQVLATSYWQGMRIQAETRTPVRFVVFNGTTEKMLRPAKGSSFHLMIMLSDRYTNEPIPYATVWATIYNAAGKTVYNNMQWPMISRYMGPHYGNNVTLPGAGRYKLKLLISPPVSARHIEYAKVWLHKHTVTDTFTWNPKKSQG